MKVCSRCRNPKPLDQFNKNSSQQDGLQSSCRDCDNQRSREYYASNGDRQRRQINVAKQSRRIEYRQLLNEAKAVGCADCGETDLVVLEFDHVRGEKSFNISRGIAMCLGRDTLLTEIAKCEIVCANCHRRRTAARDPQHWGHHLVG